MRIRKIFGYSKVTTATLLLLIGSIGLIAADSYSTQNSRLPAKDSVGFKSIFSKLPTKLPFLSFLDEPTVVTDRSDYLPGQTVNITGYNFGPNEAVTLRVTHSDGTPVGGAGHDPWTVTTDEYGNFYSSWYVTTDDSLGSTFLLTATSATSSASTTFIDAGAQSANLDQCGNDPLPSSHLDGCATSASDWVNGNLGASKSVYFEGDSIPYRMLFDNLSTGVGNPHAVTIEWDTTKSGKHAIDYITTFNRTVADANPCLGVSGCTGPGTTFAIPADPQVTGAGVTPIAGNFTMYGATIQSVSAPTSVGSTSCSGLTLGNYCYSTGTGFAGDKSAAITITFTTTVANPVLAWGGHIATRTDWGLTNSAVSISGSPYHTRLIDLDGKGGNQDRSLSADAVIFPGGITIIKDAQPNTSTVFSYTASPSPLSNFTLVDDGTASNTKVFSNITTFQNYTVTEAASTTWPFDSVSCSVTSPNGGSYTTSTSTVNINMKEGEFWSCTYINKEDRNATHGTILVDKVTSPSGSSQSFEFTPDYNSGTHFFLTDGSTPNDSGLIDPGTYSVAETQATNWTLTNATCTSNLGDPADDPSAIHLREGETVTCTFTNTRDQGYFKIKKVFDPLTSGFVGDFTIHYNCGAGDQTVSLAAGATSAAIGPFDTGTSCTVSEPSLPTAPTGWTFGTPSVSGSPVSIVKDTAATTTSLATVTNSITRDRGTFTIAKTTNNPDGATLPSFTMNYDCGLDTDGSALTGSKSVASGGSATVSGIPTGNTCLVSEVAPTAIPGFTWGTPTYTPTSIVISTIGGTFTITVHNSITRDRGTFTIAKTTNNPDGATLPSFTMNYDCGLDTDGTTALTGQKVIASGGSATVSGIPTGNACLVSEVAPTAIPGFTWGTPTYTPASIVISAIGGTFTITVGNSITRDRGTFTIAKTLSNSDGASVPTSFTINYDCGTGYTGSVSVAAGGSQTVSGIPTGNTCTVSEAALAPIMGFTWGTPTVTPASVVIADKISTFTLTVANSITRDLGSLVLAKSLSGGPAGYTGPFTINYNCGAGYTGSVSVSAGTSQTVSGIPTGTSCTVSETLPNPPPTGYSFGTPTFSPSDTVTIPAGSGSSVTVTTNNTLTRDTGSLEIKKSLSNPDGANVPASFTVSYNCGAGYTGQVSIAPGSPATISGIPTGNSCSVTEVAPAPIAGYTWGTITYSPTSITIDTKGGTFCITVTNSITRDRGSLTIVKKVVNDNGGTATVSAFGLNTSAGSLTFDSGSTSGSTTTYTSQKFVLVTATYTLKESDVYGYTEGTWSCTGAAGTVVPTYNNGSVQVGKNEDITCTIINDDQPGTIVIIKNAKPQSGTFSFDTTGSTSGPGTSWPASFTLNGATAGNANTKSFTADAGIYTARESTQMGWLLTGIGGSSDPLTPYACVVTGSGGSTGSGDLSTRTATINLKNGDTVTCTFENTGNGATRTQGFWATHPNLAIIAWNGGTSATDPAHTFPGVGATPGIGDKLLCGKLVDFPDLIGPNNSDVMGGFWSDVSKTSTGVKRSKTDNSRMSLLQQLLAAELNASAFGTSPSSGSFSAWESAYCGGNANALQTAQQQAASFNTQGDSSTFTPGTSANSKLGRLIAEYTRWDLLP